jgi:glyoxylase-like metal-dependent hydrolase (beta-lactamase superfamily II)
MRMALVAALRPFTMAACLVLAASSASAAGKTTSVRLYAMDCGRLSFRDMRMFSDDDAYAGVEGTLIVPCYLVRHPSGILLWETGLGDGLAKHRDGIALSKNIHMTVRSTLASQLDALGLTTADIDYVAVSHLDFDHTGNLAGFRGSTLLLSSQELDWARSEPAPMSVDADAIKVLPFNRWKRLDADQDVFGDGSVRILAAPGHTPGHKVLMVRLQTAGVLILSGDLWHSRASLEHSRIPSFNDSRADTLASFGRIEALGKHYKARIVVEHDAGDFEDLPVFPGFLD